jgi:hypothetical protein
MSYSKVRFGMQGQFRRFQVFVWAFLLQFVQRLTERVATPAMAAVCLMLGPFAESISTSFTLARRGANSASLLNLHLSSGADIPMSAFWAGEA